MVSWNGNNKKKGKKKELIVVDVIRPLLVLSEVEDFQKPHVQNKKNKKPAFRAQ